MSITDYHQKLSELKKMKEDYHFILADEAALKIAKSIVDLIDNSESKTFFTNKKSPPPELSIDDKFNGDMRIMGFYSSAYQVLLNEYNIRKHKKLKEAAEA